MTRTQIASRIRSMRWQIPGIKPINLWGADGKQFIPPSLLNHLINAAIKEWAIETLIDKEDWAFTTVQANVRRYSFPSDTLVITEARIAYDDDANFLGYPLLITSEPFLDDTQSINARSGMGMGPTIKQWSYRDYPLLAGDESLLAGSGKAITYASLGADLAGNTPPATFQAAPYFLGVDAEVDRQLFVSVNSVTDFTIKGGALGPSPPFNISFSFREITSSLSAGDGSANRQPERMFVWQNEFFLDPIPDKAYTLRLWGYHLPESLAADGETPSVDTVYMESLFLKVKELVARELNVSNEGQIVAQSEKVTQRAKDFDGERHYSTRFVNPVNDYWGGNG